MLKTRKGFFRTVIEHIILAHVVLALSVQGIIGLGRIIRIGCTKQGIIVYVKTALILGYGVNQRIPCLLTVSEPILIHMVEYGQSTVWRVIGNGVGCIYGLAMSISTTC